MGWPDEPETFGGVRLAPEPEKYLAGLCWLLETYIVGRCPDYRWAGGRGGGSSVVVRLLVMATRPVSHGYPAC